MAASNKVTSLTVGVRIALGFAILALIAGTSFLTFGDHGFGTALIVMGTIDLAFIGVYLAAKTVWMRLKVTQTA